MSNLRKIIQKTGFDLHRHHPAPDRLAWLASLGIKSVFDIGANVGQFAQEIRLALPSAQIYSFEPLKECYGILTTSFAGDTRFKAFNTALGSVESTVQMNKSSYTPSSSLLPMADSHKKLFPHTKDSSPETINVRRLDDIWAELKPTGDVLIKVDTQGYENEVIAGGGSAFKQARVVLIEASFVRLYEDQPLFGDIYQKMLSFGLTYQGALHQKINKETGEVIFEDAIFIREK